MEGGSFLERRFVTGRMMLSKIPTLSPITKDWKTKAMTVRNNICSSVPWIHQSHYIRKKNAIKQWEDKSHQARRGGGIWRGGGDRDIGIAAVSTPLGTAKVLLPLISWNRQGLISSLPSTSWSPWASHLVALVLRWVEWARSKSFAQVTCGEIWCQNSSKCPWKLIKCSHRKQEMAWSSHNLFMHVWTYLFS